MKTHTLNSTSKHRSSFKRGTSLSYDSRNLHSIPKIPENQLITELKLSNNPLTNFRGLHTIPSLEFLRCDNTKIESFEDACYQPKLVNLNLSKTPVAMFRLYRIMAVIVFGDSLELINYIHLRQTEKSKASFLRERLYDQLVKGWILTSTEPLRIYNPKTKARRIIYMPQPLKTMMTLYPDRTSPTGSPKKKTEQLTSQQPTLEENQLNEQQQKEQNQLAEQEEEFNEQIQEEEERNEPQEEEQNEQVYEEEQNELLQEEEQNELPHEEEQNEQPHEEEPNEQHEEEQNQEITQNEENNLVLPNEEHEEEQNQFEPDQIQNKDLQQQSNEESEPEHGPVPDYAEGDIPFEEQVRRDNEERFVEIDTHEEETQPENVPEAQPEQPQDQQELPPQDLNQNWVIDSNEHPENADADQHEVEKQADDVNAFAPDQNPEEQASQPNDASQETQQQQEEVAQPPLEEQPNTEVQKQEEQQQEEQQQIDAQPQEQPQPEQTENQDEVPPQDQNQEWVIPENGEQTEEQPNQEQPATPEPQVEEQPVPTEPQAEEQPVPSEPQADGDNAPWVQDENQPAAQDEQPNQQEEPEWTVGDNIQKNDDEIDIDKYPPLKELDGSQHVDTADESKPNENDDVDLDALINSLDS